MKRTNTWRSKLFVLLVLLFNYLPIIVVVVYSFNANTARIPIDFTGWTTAWYGKLFENRSGFGDALLLSVRVALWAVVISCIIGTLGAIGMANRAGGRHSRLDTAMESLMSLPIMIPEIILGLAFMVVFNAMGIRNGMPGLEDGHAGQRPFAVTVFGDDDAGFQALTEHLLGSAGHAPGGFADGDHRGPAVDGMLLKRPAHGGIGKDGLQRTIDNLFCVMLQIHSLSSWHGKPRDGQNSVPLGR